MTCYRHPNRETGVSCSVCGRGICPDCMVFAPVGIRCPEHSGQPQGAARLTSGVRRAAYSGTGALVTKALIAINVLVFLVNLAQGSTLSQVTGRLFLKWALYIPGGLDQGQWWRLITAAFLHASLFHLGTNMFVLWIVGAPVEQAIGRGRFLALYVVSGLAGSARGPHLEPGRADRWRLGRDLRDSRRRARSRAAGKLVLGGQAFGLIAFNLIITFALFESTSRSAATLEASSAARSHARPVPVRQDARDLRPAGADRGSRASPLESRASRSRTSACRATRLEPLALKLTSADVACKTPDCTARGRCCGPPWRRPPSAVAKGGDTFQGLERGWAYSAWPRLHGPACGRVEWRL